MPTKKKKKATPKHLIKKGAVIGFGFGLNDDFNQYLDLKQAGLETGYAPEDLAALIYENKLRAVKLGQDWLTKKCWIQDYAKRSSDWQEQSEQLRRRIEAYRRSSLAFSGCQRAWEKSSRRAPISRRMAILMSESSMVSYALLAGLLMSGLLLANSQQSAQEYGRGLLKIGRQDSLPYLKSQTRSLDTSQLAASVSVAEAAGAMANSMWRGAIFSTNNVLTEASDAFYLATKDLRDFFRYLIYGRTEVYVVTESPEVEDVVFEKSVDALEEEISDYTSSRFSDFRKEFGFTDKDGKPSVKRGTVIIPRSGKTEKMMTDLERSFSDEVEMNPTGENTGIIVPIFRENKGEEYIYIFVPVKDNE
ncbi:MAG TPA: hypothetical protein P5080_04255 [Candidatus Paceibacterota bacterium]|nr:hypothetical protein [Candidatus Pacearchaeota archaeon]HRZ51107.1 hypothetical protein [Candidatus Paceibacterota bacterium]HSA36886.1 hypothetical protein [Candidatus Paceibacterota bacterium]